MVQHLIGTECDFSH